MILQKTMQYIGLNSNFIDNCCFVWKNGMGLLVCFHTLYSLYAWNQTKNQQYITNNIQLIYFQTIIDIPFCTVDVLLHHLLTLAFISCYPHIEFEKTQTIIITLLLSEASTVFLIFKNVLHSIKTYVHPLFISLYHQVKGINNVVFSILFLYFRIYLYNVFILNHLDLIPNNEWRQLAIGSIFGFYALNMYWATFIIKGGFKMVSNTPKDSIRSENMLQYTFVIIFISTNMIYASHFITKPYLVLDVFGRLMVAICSYQYHKSVRIELEKNYPSLLVDTLSESIFPHYKNDIIGMILQSYLSLTTSVFMFHRIPPPFFMIKNTFLHGISAFLSIQYLNWLKKSNQTFLFLETTYNTKYYIITTFISIPMITTITCISLSFNETIQTIELLSLLYMCILIRIINVANSYNHVLFHIGLSFLCLYIAQRFVS